MISRVLNKVLLLVAVVASKNSFKIVPESVFMYLLVAKGWKGGGGGGTTARSIHLPSPPLYV